MNPPPLARARAGNSGSTRLNTYSASLGMLDRKRRICEPAGMMWSVLMLSPSAIRTSPLSASARGVLSGIVVMFSPLITLTDAASAGDAGGTRLGFVRSSFSGSAWAGAGIPSFRGSVITPVMADAAATSLELR